MSPQQLTAIRNNLRALLSSLTIGERVYLESLIDRVTGRVRAGDIDGPNGARQMLVTFPPLPTPSLEAVRAAALTHLS